jgi:hypothetical protein
VEWVHEDGNTGGCGHQLTQEFQPLCGQFGIEKIDARQVATRPSKAGDKTKSHRVVAHGEDGGNRRGCRLGRHHRRGISSGDHSDASANQIGRQLRQPVISTLRPAVFDCHVLAFDIAGLLQALAKSAHTVRESLGRLSIEEPDHRHGRLLRARGKRPGGRRAAE